MKGNSMPSTALLISGRTKPGKRDELYQLYLEHVTPRVADDPTIETVVWSIDRDDEDAYHLFETFAEGGSPASVTQSDWFKAYMQQATPLAAAPPAVHILEPRWTKGI
jgi:quinol monooxygenase YgiN